MIDFEPTREQLALRKKAREFALKEILPASPYFDRNDIMPVYLLKKAHAAGLQNLNIPKKYGGPGYGLLEAAMVVEEIAAADPGLATSIYGNSLGEEPILLSDNEVVKEKYLPILVKEPKIISFATSEPMMGSDVAGMRCRAEKDGEDYILNGTKYWITNIGYADYCSVFATVDPKAGHKGIAAFLVETDWDGIVIGEHIPKLGQRTSNTGAIKFENVRVPAENVLAPPGKGFALAMRTFARTRPIIGAFATGAARSAFDYTVRYIKKRRAFGRPLADFQNTRFRIAEMYQKIETMRLLTWRACVAADKGEKDAVIAASTAKFYATESAMEVVNTTLQIFAGYGYTDFFPIAKLLRDIRVLTIYEGTSEVQRIVVSKYILKDYEPIMPALEDRPEYTADDPKKAAENGPEPKTAWRCRICGYVHYGDEPPDECPYCRFPKTAFKKVV